MFHNTIVGITYKRLHDCMSRRDIMVRGYLRHRRAVRRTTSLTSRRYTGRFLIFQITSDKEQKEMSGGGSQKSKRRRRHFVVATTSFAWRKTESCKDNRRNRKIYATTPVENEFHSEGGRIACSALFVHLQMIISASSYYRELLAALQCNKQTTVLRAS